MTIRNLIIGMVLGFGFLSGISANNTPLASIRINPALSTIRSGGTLILNGQGFAPLDKIQRVSVSFLDNRENVIRRVNLADFNLKVDEKGNLAGMAKLTTVPVNSHNLMVLVFALKSNVEGGLLSSPSEKK